MASTSSHRSTSPPRPPPSSSSSQRPSSPPLSPPRQSPPRPPSPPPSPPIGDSFEYRARKRRRLERFQDKEMIHGFDLQPHALEILGSRDLSSLRTLINDLAESKFFCPQSKTLFNSFALHYPNSFSLKLAHLLQLHPPQNLRTQIVTLLHQILTETHAEDMHRIHCVILLELKTCLFQSLQIEDSLPSVFPLCETIANVACRVYEIPVGGWEELLEYVVSCIHADTELKQEIGFKLFAGLPEECSEHTELWERNYRSLHRKILQLFDSSHEKWQGLAFDSSVILVSIVKDSGKRKELADLLPRMVDFINRYGRSETTVLKRVQAFVDLVALVDVGEFFSGKVDDVFQCMLQIAEVEDVSDELRCAAIQVIKELDEGAMDDMEILIQIMSPADTRRIFTVFLNMLMCIEDDNGWYDVDKKGSEGAGISESYSLGKFLLNWVSFEGNGNVVVPMAIEILASHINDEDWRKRHAVMITLSAMAVGHQPEITRYFEHAERLVLISLSDLHYRVLWAAIEAIKCLSVNMRPAQHIKFLPKLVPFIKYCLCPRVQVHAVIAIRFLVTNCGLDSIVSFGEEIVTTLLELIKNDTQTQKLQEEVVETLKSFAVLSPAYFRTYYDRTMESLKAILFHDYSTPKFLLRAKSLECMSYIVSRVEQDKFQHKDAIQVMVSLISLEGRSRGTEFTDLSIKVHILKALDQFCRLPRVDIGKFINKLMPMLLQSAKLDTHLNPNMDINDSYCVDDQYLVQTETLLACNILSYFAVRSKEIFSPWVEKVSQIFVRLFDCSSFETQKASVSAIPNLLLSAKSAIQNRQQSIRTLPVFTVQFLVEALHKETYDDVCITMLRSLTRCIEIAGSVFTDDLIKLIADEINHILRKAFKMERGQEAGTSEGGSEKGQEEEIIQIANNLITTTVETFEARFLPYVDDLMSTVALLWGDDFPDRVKAIAISIFNILVPQFPDKLQMYYDKYTSVLLKACWDESPYAQLEAARGVGFCAVFGGHKFKNIANVAISSLYSVIERGSSISGDHAKIYDIAVSALGKICEFQRDNIEGPKVVPNWLNFLPLRSDFNEARYAHGQLSKMLQRSDEDLLGPNNENLPKILPILREILSQSDNLATEETFTVIIGFLDQHGGMP